VRAAGCPAEPSLATAAKIFAQRGHLICLPVASALAVFTTAVQPGQVYLVTGMLARLSSRGTAGSCS
jgi:hypothetical protein